MKHALVTKVEGFVDAVLHKPQANTNQPTSTPELSLPATTPMIATTSVTPQSTPPSSTPGTPTLAPSTPPATAALDLSQAFVITFDELEVGTTFNSSSGLYSTLEEPYHGLLFKITTIGASGYYAGATTSMFYQPLSPPNFLFFSADNTPTGIANPQTLALVPVSGTFSVLSIGRIVLDILPSGVVANVTYQGANEGGTCAGSLTFIGNVARSRGGGDPQDNIITEGCNNLASFTIAGPYYTLVDNILVVPGVGSSVNATAF